MDFPDRFVDYFWQLWPHILACLYVLLMVVASAHLILYKKDSRAAIGWIGVVVMVPYFGAVLYWLLGINRLQRRASSLRARLRSRAAREWQFVASAAELRESLGSEARHLAPLEKLIGQLTQRPLLGGNRVTPLVGGERAYPEMIRAIDEAQHSLSLSSYIFGNDRAGVLFVEALQRAVGRGVEVRVLIDAIGARYTFPTILGRLRRGGINVARFLPTFVPTWFAYANLRSHRKLLVADGQIGFTGGMNIREGHDARFKPVHAIHDLHFRLEGPVVAQLQEVFAEDWEFATGEVLSGATWFPPPQRAGSVVARGIATGPDGDLGKLRLTLEGALACAETSVCIVTPYFLPDSPLIAALSVAALRGVEVDIILPEANNLTMVKWASTALLWQVLSRGCRVWMSPAPFDHTKLMVVDRAWTLLGSANWDPRSLRLNFEFDVECYDTQLSGALHDWLCEKRDKARGVTLEDVDGRSIPIRLRDGLVRLLTPYL